MDAKSVGWWTPCQLYHLSPRVLNDLPNLTLSPQVLNDPPNLAFFHLETPILGLTVPLTTGTRPWNPTGFPVPETFDGLGDPRVATFLTNCSQGEGDFMGRGLQKCCWYLSGVGTLTAMRVEWKRGGCNQRIKTRTTPERLCSWVPSIFSFYTLEPQGGVGKQATFTRSLCGSQ